MRFLTMIFAFSLTACSMTGPTGPAARGGNTTIPGVGNIPSNEILIYRRAEPGVSVNVAAFPAILLDGRAIGTCRIAQPILIRVPKGTWTITALTANGEVSQEVTVEEGDRANLRCGTSPVPSLSPVPTLTSVDTVVAQNEAGL